MKFAPLTRLERNVHRSGEIILVLAKYGLADWVKGLDVPWIQDRIRSADGQQISDLNTGQRVRLAFTELGTTFIKLGQMLSTRPDLVGPDIADELAKLQTRAPADSIDAVRKTIAEELGRSPEEIFEVFDPRPLASASIAQVHTARLKSGERVVVKVQHPSITERVISDLDILRKLAEWAEKYSTQLKLYQPCGAVAQLPASAAGSRRRNSPMSHGPETYMANQPWLNSW